MRWIMLLALLAVPLSGHAEIYSWTDASGTVNFTEDPGSIPKKYRKKASRMGDAQSAPSVQRPADSGRAAAPAAPSAAKPAAPAAGGAEIQPAAAGGKTVYGGRSAAEWQQEFRSLRAELKRSDAAIEAARKETAEVNSAPRTRERLNEQNERNRQLTASHEALRLRYNKLVEDANRAGLPREYAE